MGEPNKAFGKTTQSQERPRRQDYQADWTFTDALSEYADSLEAERDQLREQNKELVEALEQIAESDHPDYPHFRSGTEAAFSEHLIEVARAVLAKAK